MKKYLLCLALLLSFLTFSANAQQLSGTYTIGTDAESDYSTFQSAIDAVASNGISDHVVFEVEDGQYTEFLSISLSGLDSTKTVSFIGNSINNVVLKSNAGYLSKPTINFDATGFINFKNMTIATTSTNFCNVVIFNNGVRDITFENIIFNGYNLPSSSGFPSNDYNIVLDKSKEFVDKNIAFKGCTFNYGKMAIMMEGKKNFVTGESFFDQNLVVENCIFNNQHSKSLYFQYQEFASIKGNTFNNTKDINNFQAMDILRCEQGTIIENNIVHFNFDSNNATGIELRNCHGSEEHPFIVRNNMVDINSGGTLNYCYDIASRYSDTSNNIIFAHNTSYLTGNGSGSNLFIEDVFLNLQIENNLLVNETENGYLIRLHKKVDTNRFCDYNVFKTNSSNFGRWGTTEIESFEMWKDSTGYDMNSHTTETVEFVSDTDLHLSNSENLTVNNPLSYVTLDIDGENRSTTNPCAGADEYSNYVPDEPAYFEDVALGENGVWVPEEDLETFFISGSHIFYNFNSTYKKDDRGMYWGGYMVSNQTDTTLSGVDAQYVAITGIGADSSNSYCVGYLNGFNATITELSGEPKVISGCYVTNNVYAYKSIKYGDGFASAFGGEDGNDPDWFKLSAVGTREDGSATDTIHFYLADYRFENNSRDYILDTWKWFDLTPLGEVVSVRLMLYSSQNNNWGMTTPGYVCIDNYDGIAPEPEDQEPFIAHQLEDILFTEYPQTFNFDLSETFVDPDPLDIITLSIESDEVEEYTLELNNFMLSVTRNTMGAFENIPFVIRATSNDLYVDLTVNASANETTIDYSPATFEDVTLNEEGYWEPPHTGESELISGSFSFYNFNDYYNGTVYYWGGFSASNQTDTTLSGTDGQYVAITGIGADSSNNYCVGYLSGYNATISELSGEPKVISGCYVTNNVYAYKSIKYGDGFVTAFGGEDGNDPDWFKLSAVGVREDGSATDTIHFYLADYRFEDNTEDYILDTWEWFDLTPLGEVVSVRLMLSSSQNNNWGMLTPGYVCIDNYDGEPPIIIDNPPVIVEQIENIHFTTYPESKEFDLNDYFTDPDPDDVLIYTVTNTSTNFTTNVNGNTLTVTRTSTQEFTEEFTIRAQSNNLYIDMTVTVSADEFETDNPPVIVEQIETIFFTDYPEEVSFNLDNYFVDPDGDELRYEIIGISNNYSATIDNANLLVKRETESAFNEEFVIKAISNDLFVEMTVNVSAEEYIDQPPYVINPVDDIIFTDFPEEVEISLEGTVTEPDDDDNLITYEINSITNDVDFTISLNEKLLFVKRNNPNQSESTIVIRATSNGKYIDFIIDVIAEETIGIVSNNITVKVFPNPASNFITIENIFNCNYIIYNNIGQVVLNGKLDNNNTIDIQNLDMGIYVIKIISDKDQISLKFIKK
ncbi:MAG: DUF4465 domain-containing protein [Bacteroidales bacterium]